MVDGTHRQRHRRLQAVAVAQEHGVPVLALVVRADPAVALSRQRTSSRWIQREHVLAHHAAITAALPGLCREGYAAVLVADPPATGVCGQEELGEDAGEDRIGPMPRKISADPPGRQYMS